MKKSLASLLTLTATLTLLFSLSDHSQAAIIYNNYQGSALAGQQFISFDGASTITIGTSQPASGIAVTAFRIGQLSIGPWNGQNVNLTSGTIASNTSIDSTTSWVTSKNFGSTFINQYVGLEYSTNSGTSYDYGWMNLTFSVTGTTYKAAINAVAINNTPGEAILAGQTVAVPEPSTYALLTLGAAALLVRARRKRKA